MTQRHKLWLLLVVPALVLEACRTAPIYNPHVAFPSRDPNAVEQAILKALANRHWLASQEAPGVIVGTLNIRDHQAMIRIEYTETSYSIRYADSRALMYERKANGQEVIHRNYNGWIKNLVHDINASLGIPFES